MKVIEFPDNCKTSADIESYLSKGISDHVDSILTETTHQSENRKMALILVEKIISDWVYETYNVSHGQNMIGFSETNLLARV